MTGLVDTAKEFNKSLFDPKETKGPQSRRFTEVVRRGKKLITAGQKADPGSKYLGISGVPGVKSQKEIMEDKKTEEAAALANEAARAAEYERTHPAPFTSEASKTLARKRTAAQQRRRSGRLSTILSDETLG